MFSRLIQDVTGCLALLCLDLGGGSVMLAQDCGR